MSSSTGNYQIPRPVRRKVSRLRRLVRMYVLLEGIVGVAIVVGSAFWLGLAIDWTFEPSTTGRGILWVLAAALAAGVAYRLVLRRLFAQLPDDSLALMVERHYPQFDEALVTTIQASHRERGSAYQQELIRQTGESAAAAVPGVSLRRILDWRPLRRKFFTALGLAGSVAGFALSQQDAFATWIRRMTLSEEAWPRKVALSVEGFEIRQGERTVHVAQGDEFEVNVLASIVDGHEAPQSVQIRWWMEPQDIRGGGPMVQIGEAVPGRDTAQRYRYNFEVSSDLRFDVIGGDDRIENLRLRAVPRPVVRAIQLQCEYPAYMQRAARSLSFTDQVAVPEGSRGTCRVVASKPLTHVRAHEIASQQDLPVTIREDDPSQFEIELSQITTDRSLAITMSDEEGVENREPYRVAITVVPDKVPEVSVQLSGISTAVTPTARIPVVGRMSDDYGLQQYWYSYQVDDAPQRRRNPVAGVAGKFEIRAFAPFDLAEVDPQTQEPLLRVSPGEKLVLSLRARDGYDLTETPHVGSSQRFSLDVVTASQLRGILERRELGLRQRFEAIYEKMLGTQELLDRIDAASAGAQDEDSVRQRDLSRLTGARQNATQLAFETLGVAEGFEEIVAELVNNRIDTQQLTERLLGGVAEPLGEIGRQLLPELEKRLSEATAAYASEPSAAPDRLGAARLQAANVAAAMQDVLDHMLELESYNELVELLRKIIQQQQELNEQTKTQQRSRLRGLLED
jgi:hypothetical protein